MVKRGLIEETSNLVILVSRWSLLHGVTILPGLFKSICRLFGSFGITVQRLPPDLLNIIPNTPTPRGKTEGINRLAEGNIETVHQAIF